MMSFKKGRGRRFFVALAFVIGLSSFVCNVEDVRADTVTVDGQTFTYNMTRSYVIVTGANTNTDPKVSVDGGYNKGLTSFTNGWRDIDITITFPDGNFTMSGPGTTCSETLGCTYTLDGGSNSYADVPSTPGTYTVTFLFRVKRRISNVQTDTFTQTRTITYTVTGPAPTATISATGPVAFESQSLWQKAISLFTGRDHVARASGTNPTITVGQNAQINWSSADASTCSIDNGIGSVTANASGNRRLTGLTAGSYTYTITCRKSGFADATDSVTVTVTNPSTYTITASAGTGGSISPSGTVSNIAAGSNRSFTISPNTGYAVSNVVVDGGSVGAVTSYTFSNITANHTISVSFSAVGGSSCSSGVSRTWSANGNSCTGTTPATGDGLLGNITDSTGPNTGSAQYRCNNGSWAASPQSGQTCVSTGGGAPDLYSQFYAMPIGCPGGCGSGTVTDVVNNALQVGKSVYFAGATFNQGTASAGSLFYDTFEYCWGVGCTPTTPLGNTSWSSLDVGSSRSEISALLSFAQSGTLRVSYCADKPPAIGESNESNNCEVRSFTVGPGTAAVQPNLTISQASGDITVNNPPGIRFSSIIYNNDAQTAAGQNIWSDVEIDWNNASNCASATVDTSRTTGGPWSGVGSATPGSINWSMGVFADYASGELQNGTHCFRHRVDRGGLVTESNDSDNDGPWRQLTISGLAATPVTTFTGSYPGQSSLTTLNLPAGGAVMSPSTGQSPILLLLAAVPVTPQPISQAGHQPEPEEKQSVDHRRYPSMPLPALILTVGTT